MEVKHHVYFRKPITTEDVDAQKLNTEIQNCEEQRSKTQSFFTPNVCYLHEYTSEARGVPALTAKTSERKKRSGRLCHIVNGSWPQCKSVQPQPQPQLQPQRLQHDSPAILRRPKKKIVTITTGSFFPSSADCSDTSLSGDRKWGLHYGE